MQQVINLRNLPSPLSVPPGNAGIRNSCFPNVFQSGSSGPYEAAPIKTAQWSCAGAVVSQHVIPRFIPTTRVVTYLRLPIHRGKIDWLDSLKAFWLLARFGTCGTAEALCSLRPLED